MDMDNLPAGSKNVRVRRSETVVRSEPAPETPTEEKPKVEKIVMGKVTVKKPGLGSRFKNMLFGGETNGVGNFLLQHVIVPAAKDMVADAVREGVERMVYGETRGANPRSRPGSGSGTFTNYSGFGNNRSSSLRPDPASDPRPQLSRQARRNHNFGEVVLESRAAATEVLRRLDARIQKYDSVSVSELYQMLDITPDWTDEKYGWYDISSASIRSARGGGYLLDLPPTEPLN